MSALTLSPPVSRAAPPWPLNSSWRQPWNLCLKFVWLGLTIYVTTKIYAGFYYTLTQTVPWITHHWNMIPAANRHDIRDIGEGYAAGHTAQFVVWNHWKPKSFLTRLPGGRQMDALAGRFERALHLPQANDGFSASGMSLVFGILMMALYAVPGYFIGKGIVALFHHFGIMHHALAAANVTIGSHVSVVHRELLTLQANWPKKLIGIFCAVFFGRRAGRGVYDDLQIIAVATLAGFVLAHWRLVKSTWPSGFTARYVEYRDTAGQLSRPISKRTKHFWIGVAVFCTVMFGVGWYVLLFIANK